MLGGGGGGGGHIGKCLCIIVCRRLLNENQMHIPEEALLPVFFLCVVFFFNLRPCRATNAKRSLRIFTTLAAHKFCNVCSDKPVKKRWHAKTPTIESLPVNGGEHAHVHRPANGLLSEYKNV